MKVKFKIGNHGYGDVNQRGKTLLNFIQEQDQYVMYSFFKKKAQRK